MREALFLYDLKRSSAGSFAKSCKVTRLFMRRQCSTKLKQPDPGKYSIPQKSLHLIFCMPYGLFSNFMNNNNWFGCKLKYIITLAITMCCIVEYFGTEKINISMPILGMRIQGLIKSGFFSWIDGCGIKI